YCNCNILTYKNVGHSYTEYYIDNEDNLYHRSYCRCGEYILENHTWVKALTSTLLPNTGELVGCGKCGAMPPDSSGTYA
ncbi:MAG: hypothetical protein LUD19_02770, partial [Clostridia bacterium]|nr:hypothetical protein [Clostridia bacterium]